MTQAIKYDKHVKNLIAELSATGHVTHTKHKKKSVTFHHNAGVRVSHEGVLSVWKSRPASAHFDVNFLGDIAQFVAVDEYAWATGNTEGNQESISIELANSGDGPHWNVSEKTWKNGARLAGWLFVHVIKEKPTHKNVLPHRHWVATSCPGPFVSEIFDRIVEEVQKSYDYFKGQDNVSEEVEKELSAEDKIKKIQNIFDLPADGKWGPKTDEAVLVFRKKHRIT